VVGVGKSTLMTSGEAKPFFAAYAQGDVLACAASQVKDDAAVVIEFVTPHAGGPVAFVPAIMLMAPA
jgi:hypothetical protein